MGILIGTRKTVDTYISRVKGQLYQEVPGDKISNLFDAKIINKTRSEFPITLRLENGEGTIRLVGSNVFTLKKESINEFTFFLDLPKSALTERSNDIKIGVYNGEERIQTVSTKFLGPFK